MRQVLDAIMDGDVAGVPIPPSYRGVVVRRDETSLFDGMDSRDKDPRKSLHVQEVPTPDVGPGEALIAVMGSAINYNTVWTSIFEPVSTFTFLQRYGRVSDLANRHDLPYHVVGSDAAGVVLRVGAGVTKWKPGDEVVAHCLSVELEDAAGHDDTMLDPQQRIWGFETNFGGLAELALVKANQLMPKPATCPGRRRPARAGQLDRIPAARVAPRRPDEAGRHRVDLGRVRRLGSYAVQLALGGGAIPVCVVSSPDKAELCRRMGAELVIDRAAEDFRFWRDEHTQDPAEWKRFGERVRQLTGGDDPDIVFEHPGRETFGVSVYVAARGGTIVTCASTSGFMHEYDNRYLWMNLKRIIGSHFANYREAWEANRLIATRRIHPTLSKAYPLEQTGQAAYDVHRNLHQGKVGVLCLAPAEGLGVRTPRTRARHLTRSTGSGSVASHRTAHGWRYRSGVVSAALTTRTGRSGPRSGSAFVADPVASDMRRWVPCLRGPGGLQV
jgi:crotonyl-CoA reductase